MSYGVPYMGSKNRIAKQVVAALPAADTLVDLFAGGCAVTHCAMLAGKYRHYIINDINDTPRLFADAVAGRYRDENRWISREEFFEKKDSDPYARVCFSFGNNGRTYMYHRELEPYKRAVHYAIVFDDWAEMARLCPETVEAARTALSGVTDRKQRRRAFGPAIVRWMKANGTAEMIASNRLYQSIKYRDKPYPVELPSLQSLQRLESLESLERLQSLQRASMERLTVMQRSYDEVELPEGAIVYCDIPYRGTGGYNGTGFDHDRFYRWALTIKQPLFISEFTMPEADFVSVKEISHRSIFAKQANNAVTERIFRPRWQVEQEQRAGTAQTKPAYRAQPLQLSFEDL